MKPSREHASDGPCVESGQSDPFELLTIDELVRLSKRSRRTIHRDIAADRLRVVKLGASTRVPRPEAERYLSGFTNGTA
jgi:hypothetical protein